MIISFFSTEVEDPLVTFSFSCIKLRTSNGNKVDVGYVIWS